jgi:hypothetical protein
MSNILSDIRSRMDIGKARYGHGVRVEYDTTTWGTQTDSWVEMAREELLDAIIYIVADYIRKHDIKRDSSESDDNSKILEYIEDPERMGESIHKLNIYTLKTLLNLKLFIT